MQTINQIKRREFLCATAGATGLLALRGAMDLSAASGAEVKDKQLLQKLLEEMETKGRQMLSVPRKDGQFLNLLVKASRARKVLEVGTSQGYSTIWISLGLEETGGKMTTIDIVPEKVQLAKANLTKAGLSSRVKLLEGDAHKILSTLDGPFDFVFLDADKEGQPDYFNRLYPTKLVPGGIVAVHNAIRMGNAMKEYLDMISRHPDFDAVVLSLTMDDGFSIAYRHRS